MQGHNIVPAFTLPRNADVTHHTANPSTGNENALTFLPNFVQFRKKSFVVLDVPELRLVASGILLERPIRW
jgi:hypothetical protein